jgi:RHS repeat-associated protein
MQIAYIYGPQGLLSQVSGGQTYIYFHNLQGSTAALLDLAGTQKNGYRYDPFGQKLPSSTEQVANPFGFLGGASVLTVGQYSLTLYRVYDSRAGRFTSADPVRYKTNVALSAFVYANQSPFRLTDSTGLTASPPMLGSMGSTSLSTPATLLTPGAVFSGGSPCLHLSAPLDSRSACLLNLADNAASLGELLGPSYQLVPIPGQAGAFKVVNKAAPLEALGYLTFVASTAASAYQDANNPGLSAGMKIGRTSANIGLGSNPFTGIPYGIASLVAPDQTDKVVNWALNGLGNALGTYFVWSANQADSAQWLQQWSSSPNWLDY